MKVAEHFEVGTIKLIHYFLFMRFINFLIFFLSVAFLTLVKKRHFFYELKMLQMTYKDAIMLNMIFIPLLIAK